MKSRVSEEVIGAIIREDITRSHHYLGQFTRVGQEVDEPVSPFHILLNGNFEYPADVCVRVVLRILVYCPSAAAYVIVALVRLTRTTAPSLLSQKPTMPTIPTIVYRSWLKTVVQHMSFSRFSSMQESC
jgi:hypothetical protein